MSGHHSRNVGLALGVAFLALGTVALGAWLIVVVSGQQARLVRIESRFDDLQAQEQLVAAQLLAVPPTGTAVASGQSTATPSRQTSAATIPQVAGRFVSFSARPYGWSVVIRPGQLYRGQAAFAIATSRGELPHNDMFIDGTSTRTVSLRLVRAAPVKLLGWRGARASALAKATTADLAKVAAPGSSGRAPWSGGWYLFSIPDNVTVVSVEQLNTR